MSRPDLIERAVARLHRHQVRFFLAVTVLTMWLHWKWGL